LIASAALLLICVAGIVLVLQAKSHIWGFCALIAAAVVSPIEVRGPSGSTLSSPFFVAGYLCLAWVITLVVFRKSDRVDSSRVVISLSTFLAVYLISFAVGQYPWFSIPGAPLPAQVIALSLFLFSGGLFLASGHEITTLLQLRRLTFLFVITGTIVCVVDLVPSLGFADRLVRPDSLGSLFWTWLLAISVSQAAFNNRLHHFARAALFLVSVLVLFRGLVVANSWVSGWLPPVVALGVILFFWFPRITIGFGFLSLPVALVLASKAWTVLMSSEQYSYITRLEAWKILWQTIARSPFLGLGPANYYYYTSLFPILGWYVSFNSHNNYMDLLAQGGFLGLLAFVWFGFELSRLAVRLYFFVPSGFPRAYVVGVVGGLAGTFVSGMLADWIIPFYYNIGIRGFRSSLLFWIFSGGVLALKRIMIAHSLSMPLTSEAA